jgi:pilus assembly protein Flp/PilA
MLDYLRILLNARLARMDERGASAVEYALIVAAVVLVMISVTAGFVIVLRTIFQTTCNKNAASGTTC